MTKDKARKRANRARASAAGTNYTAAHRDDPHLHDGFRSPDEDGSAYGLNGRIDMAPIGLLIGAGWDRCQPCQAKALDQLANAPAAAARLVELVGMITMDTLGGLPRAMLDDNAPRAGSHHPGLRAALRASMSGPVDGEIDRQSLYRVVAALSPVDRRAMCDNGADTLIGQMLMGAGAAMPDPGADRGGGRTSPYDGGSLNDGRALPVVELAADDPRRAGFDPDVKVYDVFPIIDGNDR
jgi:hypothetical protein